MRESPALEGMEVYIFRHARADFGSKNHDPPISKEGAAETRKVMDLARRNLGFEPTAIVSSPVLRAKQTAELAREQLGMKEEVVIDDCLYGDTEPAEVLKFLSRFKKEDRVVLVSHMPLIFELLYTLLGGRCEVELLNGSMAAVTFKGRTAEGKGKLTWLVQPQA
jgi:phosphohistidine phosphatase